MRRPRSRLPQSSWPSAVVFAPPLAAFAFPCDRRWPIAIISVIAPRNLVRRGAARAIDRARSRARLGGAQSPFEIRRRHRAASWSFTAGVFATRSAAGADASGYISESAMLSSGRLFQADELADLRRGHDPYLTSPLGWRPAGDDRQAPTYPPGLPLLMAIPHAIAGVTRRVRRRDCGRRHRDRRDGPARISARPEASPPSSPRRSSRSRRCSSINRSSR